jgi:hypothetical protein
LHDYLPKHPLQIKIEDLAYWFWFSQGIAVCQTFLFFKNNPVLGTLASYLPTFGFALFLGSSFLVSKRFKFTNVLQTIPAKSLVLLILWAGTTLWWTRVNSLFSAFGYWTGMAILLAFPVYLAVTKISFQKKIALLWLTGCLGQFGFNWFNFNVNNLYWLYFAIKTRS